MSACRYVYNQAIAELKDKGNTPFRQLAKTYREQTGTKPTDSQYFRTLIVGNDNLPQWVKDAPRNIKDNAVEEAWDAYIQARANGGTPTFRSCKSPSCAMKFNPKNFNQGTWYPKNTLEHGGSFDAAEPLPESCMYSTSLVKQRDRWYAIIPTVVVPELAESKRVIALDPGVRTFLTGYDGDQVIEIATGDIGRIYRLCQHLDQLLSRAAKAPKKQRRRMHQAANRMRCQIRNLVDELHHKSAAYLTDNYKLIFLPTFETSNMVGRNKRKIGRKSVRAMMTWSHYRFKQHLKQVALRKGVVVVETNESYTSKTCGRCGHIHEKLGGASVFKCPQCGHEILRDHGGARNILLRALRESSFVVSDDVIAIAVNSL